MSRRRSRKRSLRQWIHDNGLSIAGFNHCLIVALRA
jgi:hypothetical protein